MSMPEDPSKVQVSIDAVLASLNRRISALVMDCAMNEAQVQQLTEQLSSVQAENAQLNEMVSHLQAQVETPSESEPEPAKLQAVPPK